MAHGPEVWPRGRDRGAAARAHAQRRSANRAPWGLIPGIVAITKGASTAADVRRTGQTGRGKAVAGEVLGVIGVAVSIGLPIVFGFLL